jgi:hypothetical protein
VSRFGSEDLALLVVAFAGFVASVRGDAGGLAGLFGALALLDVLAVVRRPRRRAVRLRADLGAWLDEVSATTGEPAPVVLDRAVSAYRAAMEPSTDRHG